MSLHRIYQWTEYGQSVKPELKLALLEWDMLFAMDGKQSLCEIIRQIEVDPAEAKTAVEQLLSYSIIEEKRISYQEYQQRNSKTHVTAGNRSSATAIELPPVPGYSDAAEKSQTHRSLSVSAVINFIIRQARSDTEGQIAVYRVFLRVPPELLQKNQISSLSMVNDQTTVDDQELQQALTHAVEETLQLSLPESVFV